MKIQLKRSNVLDGALAKEPTAAQMEYGELAVNYNNGDPVIFMKNSADEIIRIAGAGAPGGGGGAGCWKEGTTPLSSSTTYPISVGGGGGNDADGTESFIGPPGSKAVSSPGGGAGGDPSGIHGNPGGSGPPSTSNTGQGGGGAGGAGQNGTGPGPEQAGGPGGAGVQLPTTFRDPNQTFGQGPGSPTPYHWVAGGGAGGCHAPPNNHNNKAGAGGGGVEGSYINPNAGASPIASDATPYAGGGNGGYGRGDNTSRFGDDGMMNTGGGGGGGGTSVPEGTNGGRGGAGLVMIAYPT